MAGDKIVLWRLLALLAAAAPTALATNMFGIDQLSPNELLQAAYEKEGVAKRPKLPATKPFETMRLDSRRPIWVLGHMVNSIKELDYRLGKGANAVEADVTFGVEGDPLYMYHGPPCDCWRHCYQHEDFNTYLAHVREIALDQPNGIGQNLSLLLLDLKLAGMLQSSKVRAGTELAKSILGNLFVGGKIGASSPATTSPQAGPSQAGAQAPFYLILSINHVQDIDVVHNFVHYLEINNSSHLLSRIGFEVGMNDDVSLIETMWRRFGNNLNIWQGDGYTNCFSPFYSLVRLSKAIAKRDDPKGYPAKVYHWTIDLHDRIRESLLLGVDAIMTNHPERVQAVLSEPDIAHQFRLANRFDDPFKKLIRMTLAQIGESARYQRSAGPAGGSGFFGAIADMAASWFEYIKEIPFLSFPTTTRLFSRFVSPATSSRSAAAAAVAQSPQQQQQVNTRGQPEYKLEQQNATAASSGQTAQNQTAPVTEYEGPKWYTKAASNMLVSLMKNALPTRNSSNTSAS